MLRYVGRTTATVWVQTDGPAEVEVLGHRAATFSVCGRHYALVEVGGLAPGSVTPYQVRVDGVLAWPLSGSPWPDSRIRTRGGPGPVQVVFGSCRHAESADPARAARLGADALAAYAVRLATVPIEDWPGALLLLGDQVYADNPTPQFRRWLDARRDTTVPPGQEVADFVEYAQLYRESWAQDEVRWLLSTVPTAMIFDDHDVRDDWNTSAAWRSQVAAQPWWPARIRGALASYWVYQHLGNLAPQQRHADPVWRAVREADGDAWPVLQDMADAADAEPTSIRWSFRWDFAGVRLVMVDTRCGRVLAEGGRSILGDAEFSWVEQTISEPGAAHLLIGSSVPWLLAPAIHDVESANEAACARGSARAETFRQAVDLEHWAAFRRSFHRFAALVQRVATGPQAPATINVLSGDVHHSYVARADFGGPAGSPVYQLVCSPVHHRAPWVFQQLLRAAWSRPLARVVRRLVRSREVPDPPLSWHLVSGPFFGNALATLMLGDRRAELVIERAGRGGRLHPAARVEQVGG